jgi:CheY-like chemotaxis protein
MIRSRARRLSAQHFEPSKPHHDRNPPALNLLYDNVQRFSLGGAAHRPPRSGSVAGIRAGERKRVALNRCPRFLDAATAAGNRASALTHRLLAFARRQALNTQSNDINQLITGIKDLLTRTLGVEVSPETKLAPDLQLALAGSNQLENALLNLAINARDAMPDGGLLTIETENARLDADYAARHEEVTAGDYVAISVSDTGTGMPPEVVEKALDPFFTTKPVGAGTGLGLSMVYGFIKQSRGHLHIYSEVGNGTTVKLYLACGPTDAVDLPLAMAEAIETPPGQGETILVVEDDASVRLLLVSALQEVGYHYREAPDASTAIAMLRSGLKPDSLITDVGLPIMNGRQLVELARGIHPSLKVLFITGYAATAVVRGGFLEAGMDMMTNPFALDALGLKVREMIER